ncbi:MAG: hypothetical protein HOY71_33150, partial [Nonomuraea sp.]|nr:hypothetical protein [Nonomuraea sp.]
MNWERIGRRAAGRPWAARVLSRVEAEYRDTVVEIPGPELPSAWTHHYFCDDDGAPLRFEGDGHACTRCDRRYAGEPWDGAWRTRRHNEAAAQAQRAALLIRLAGEPPGELERILAGYDYLAYAPHGVNAGTGRVQPQSLDEAVWAIGLLRALRWSGIAAPPGMETMASGVVDLLRPQVGGVHNIHCWLLAALAECAALLRDRALLGWCGQRVEEQVLSGFHPEGLWYEVNPHYHY